MDAPTRNVTDEGLVRAIGVRALALNIVNLVIGAGIFVLPGVVAAQLGSAVIVAYLTCSLAIGLVFLCFAEAGSRVSRSGGAYAYVEDAFGPFPGFLASMLLWFGWGVLSSAALAVALAEMLTLAWPWFGAPLPKALFIIAFYVVVAVVNAAGVKSGVRFAVFSTWAKLTPLILLIAFGIFAVRWENLERPSWPSLHELGPGTLLLFFTFVGAELALNTGGEIQQPARTVPRALLLGLTGIFVLYLSLQLVAQGVLGPELATNTEAPLAAAAGVAMGSWGRALLLLGGGISILGNISCDMLCGPRVIFGAARDGLLPAGLARVHPRYRTPHVAIFFYSALACAFALGGTFKTLAVVSTGSLLMIYLGCSLAVLQLRRRAESGEVFRVPGGPLVPILSSILVVWLLSNLTREEAAGLGLLLAVSVLLFVVQRILRRGGGVPGAGNSTTRERII